MRHLATHSLTVASLVSAVPAVAQFEPPPNIEIVVAERRVSARVDTDQEHAAAEKIETGEGVFDEFLFADAGGRGRGYAYASQDSRISSFRVTGAGSAYSDATIDLTNDASVSTEGLSKLTINFTTPVDAEFTLSATLLSTESTPLDPPICLSSALLSMAGFDANGAPFFYINILDCDSPQENLTVNYSGTVGAGQTIGLSLQATVQASAAGYEPPENWGLGNGGASFSFTLDFGDRDEDGLLDEWETNGIDFTGEGVEIDLPGMGADPNHKDIFVELDVMEDAFGGSLYDADAAAAIASVVEAFAQSPVGNPDQEDGIDLHVLVDEQDVANASFSGALADLYGLLQAIRGNHFGTLADRAHPQATEILQAKKEIFHYALWADDLFIDGEARTGFGETPGDDLVVAAGASVDFWQAYGYSGSELQNALAGTFMHELGHNLGRQHGGQDEVNNKPHYQSVMNYSYQIPLPGATDRGTPRASVWGLDYSWRAQTLDELKLDEMAILDVRRPILFNSAGATDTPPVHLSIASPGPIDWNGNDVLDPGDVVRDITRMGEEKPLALQDNLGSSNDWERLWYHLDGAPGFEASPTEATLDVLSIGIPYTELELYLEAEVTDQRATGPVIFYDGFNFGDTEAWSATVP